MRNPLAKRIERAVLIENAAQALVDDVRRRYPDQEFRCPYMRALDEALVLYPELKSDLLSARQRRSARHALGLPELPQVGARKVSYRNHFVAGDGHNDYPDWMQMVHIGAAIRHHSRALYGGDLFCFTLTRTGAEAALYSDERLDPEDFPDAAQHR